MSFENFLRAIEAPALRDIALHWNAARGTKRMPAWKDIKPEAIAPYLGIIWSWIYDRDTDSFTGRLAGEDIIAAFGQTLRGKPMAVFFARMHYETIFARHRRVVTEPAFAHGQGAVFIHADRYGQGERIIMPLASDGIQGDGIFGATVYPLKPNAEAGDVPREYLAAEQVDFFPLDGSPAGKSGDESGDIGHSGRAP